METLFAQEDVGFFQISETQVTSSASRPVSHLSKLSAQVLSAMLDEMDVGALLCSVDGDLVHANAAGWAELQHHMALGLDERNRVHPRIHSERAALTNGLIAAAKGRRHLLQFGKGGERLMLAALPLAAGQVANGLVLLLLGRRSVAPPLVVEMLCRMHDLTHAEQRVLEGLLGGTKTNDMASRFGVKLSTVRTQIAALRTKFGLDRVCDALRLASALPPVLGALRSTRAERCEAACSDR